MKCLAPNECSDWLRERGIVESPYGQDTAPDVLCLQFEPPEKPSELTAFTRALFDSFGEFPGALVVFTDWELYHPDEMAVFESLRRSHGDRRPLIDAPGHLFKSEERAEAIAHIYLAVLFGWTAYLYLSSRATTVLFWEGDLVDVWAGDERLLQAVRGTVETYELRVTANNVV
jgi:hypothetical protein